MPPASRDPRSPAKGLEPFRQPGISEQGGSDYPLVRAHAGMLGSRSATRRSPATPGLSPKLVRERLACADPVFKGMLGNPAVKRQISEAMKRAVATPNRGEDGDVPGNGSEQGFLAAKFPWIGTRSGPFLPNWRERNIDFDFNFTPFPYPFVRARDLTGIHTHQSPRGEPGLSAADLAITKSSKEGPGINIVAVGRDGRRYCKVAQR